MYSMNSFPLPVALFLCLYLWLSLTAQAQKSISDTGVEQRISRFQYQEAANLIAKKLKRASELDIDHRLYYTNRFSYAQLRLRNIDSALMFARSSLRLAAKSNDSTLVVDAWKVAAYSYNNGGKLDSALFFTRRMLLFGERNHDEKLQRNAIISMATILSQNKRYEEALHYYRDASDLTLRLNDTANFSTCKYNLGLTFLNLKQTDSCLVYLQQAAELLKKRQQFDQLIYVYGTMADCYLNMKNEKERKKYLLLANDIAEKIGAKQFLAMGYSNLASGALGDRNYGEAIGYGQKALSLLKEQPYPVLQMKLDSTMCLAYKGMGNFSEAYASLESFIKEKEKLVGERQQQQLNELVVNLQVREKDLTIISQQFEITRKQMNMRVLVLVIVIILLLVLGQFIYILNQRRFRKELFRKEKDLDQQTLEIRNWMEWKRIKPEEEDDEIENITVTEDVVNDKMVYAAQALLFTELREVFDKQKLYLDPELNLKTVIRVLGTNQKYLYQAISGNSDNNFRSFLNRYRVDEAKKIIEQKIRGKKELNLSELYSSAGFHSPVSFYRAFKLVTGLTPKDYAAEIRWEVKNGKETNK